MDASKWIFAVLGILGLWIVVSTILNFQDGVARRRDGKMISRAEQPQAFWLAATFELLGGTVFIAAVVAVLFFNLPIRP